MAERIQRKRVKGWRMPEGAVYVGRPTKWGNFSSVKEHVRDEAIIRFSNYLEEQMKENPEQFEEWIAPLRGKDLACWCALESVCHADVLLRLANIACRKEKR